MAQWWKLNPYRMLLDAVVREDPEQVVGAVLSALRTGIGATIKRVDGLPEDHPLIDDECALIEEYLGVSYVTCQAYITTIAARSQSLLEHYHRKHPSSNLAGLEAKRWRLLRAGPTMPKGDVTRVQVIDALANCYKHRDQWNTDQGWNRAGNTVAVIEAAGIHIASTGTMREGAAQLGNPDFAKVSVFVDILREWKDALAALLQRDLKARGLVS